MKFIRFCLFVLIAGFVFSSCQKQLGYSVLDAKGTLKDNGSGDCLPVTIYGSYQKDTLLLSSNSVDVQVNISQLGNYTIKTDTINGFSFSATGTAAIPGLNTIHMQASGRPILPEVDVFHVRFDTSACQINIVVTGVGAVANDSIVADIAGVHKTFKINDTARYDNTTVPGYHLLNIFGGSNAIPDEFFQLGVGLPGTTLTPVAGTTYDVTQSPANFVGGVYQNNITSAAYLVASGFTTTPAPVFQIKITSITATKVKGTFTGAIPDAFGIAPDLQVTNGVFSVTIYP